MVSVNDFDVKCRCREFVLVFCRGNMDIDNPYLSGAPCGDCPSTCNGTLCGEALTNDNILQITLKINTRDNINPSN